MGRMYPCICVPFPSVFGNSGKQYLHRQDQRIFSSKSQSSINISLILIILYLGGLVGSLAQESAVRMVNTDPSLCTLPSGQTGCAEGPTCWEVARLQQALSLFLSGWAEGFGAFGVVMTASFYEAQTQTTEKCLLRVILSLQQRLRLIACVCISSHLRVTLDCLGKIFFTTAMLQKVMTNLHG